MKVALTKLSDSIRNDISRTAIVLDQNSGEGTSIDLVTPQGEVIARLNLFAHDSGKYTFDLCFTPCELELSKARVTSWSNANRNEVFEGNTQLLAIHLS